jgi:hypothetical protein
MTDLQELRRHVKLLEDYFEEQNDLAEQIAELKMTVEEMATAFDENLSAMARAFVKMTEAVDLLPDKVNELARRKK